MIQDLYCHLLRRPVHCSQTRHGRTISPSAPLKHYIGLKIALFWHCTAPEIALLLGTLCLLTTIGHWLTDTIICFFFIVFLVCFFFYLSLTMVYPDLLWLVVKWLQPGCLSGENVYHVTVNSAARVQLGSLVSRHPPLSVWTSFSLPQTNVIKYFFPAGGMLNDLEVTVLHFFSLDAVFETRSWIHSVLCNTRHKVL